MKEWLMEKMSAGDGSIRKLWGHRLMKFGIFLIVVNFFSTFNFKSEELWMLKAPDSAQLIYYVFGLAAALLGIGNITDIWKINKKDTSKIK